LEPAPADPPASLTLPRAPAPSISFRRLTDFVGLNESPAISPDGRMVAFVAMSNGRRHVWVQLLAGGPPLRLTNDALDHTDPRWSPDSSALIYFTPPADDETGTIWEVSSLGGTARPIVSSLSPGDLNHA